MKVNKLAIIFSLFITIILTSCYTKGAPLPLQEASKSKRNNKEYVLLAISYHPKQLQYASDKLKDDEDVVNASIKKEYWTIKYASERLKDNFNIISKAIDHSLGYPEGVLKYASPRLQDNDELVVKALKMHPHSLQYASPRLQDNEEVAKYGNLQFASNRLKDDFDFVRNKLFDSYLPYELQFISYRLRTNEDIVLYSYAIQYSYSHRNNFYSFGINLKDNADFFLEIYRYENTTKKSNENILFKLASDNLKNDFDIVSKIIEKDYRIYYYISDELKEKKEIVFKVLEKDYNSFFTLSDELKNDNEIALKAIDCEFNQNRHGNYTTVFEALAPHLYYDSSIACAVLFRITDGYTYVNIHNDKQLILSAISKNPYAMFCASHELQKDEEVLLAVSKHKNYFDNIQDIINCHSDNINNDIIDSNHVVWNSGAVNNITFSDYIAERYIKIEYSEGPTRGPPSGPRKIIENGPFAIKMIYIWEDSFIGIPKYINRQIDTLKINTDRYYTNLDVGKIYNVIFSDKVNSFYETAPTLTTKVWYSGGIGSGFKEHRAVVETTRTSAKIVTRIDQRIIDLWPDV